MPDLLSNLLLTASGIALAVVLYLLFVSRNAKRASPVVPPPKRLHDAAVTITDIETAEAKRTEAIRKGNAFEQFMVGRFLPAYYKIEEHRKFSDGMPRFVEAQQKPDLEIVRVNTAHPDKRFAVECKYKSNERNGRIKICEEQQFIRYKNYSSSQGIPVFIALGLGGTEGNPEKLFVIPIDEAKPEFVDVRVYANYEIPFATKHLYFDPEKRHLK